jgi:hypothetical protein
MKQTIIIIVAIFIISLTMAEEASIKVHPWFALSTLWGQGGTGLQIQDISLREYGVRYNFVVNWYYFDFTYHEVDLFTRKEKFTLGIRYRCQLSQDEYTPYIGYFIPLRINIPMSIYNEAEYRFNSVVKDEDYLRTRHIFTVYIPYWVQEKIFLRPYIALDSFIDWDEIDYEKLKLNIGYFINFDNATARIYFIPWSDGVEEQEWDDQRSIGATLTYHW